MPAQSKIHYATRCGRAGFYTLLTVWRRGEHPIALSQILHMKTIVRIAFAAFFLVAAVTGFAQSAVKMRTTSTPLVVNGKWMMSSYDYDSNTGEYYFVVKGKPVLFDDYFKKSKDYINNTIWVDMLTITYKGKEYSRYGLPRILNFDDVKAAGKYKGILVMAETGVKAATPEVIYIPHSASMGSASFQPYQLKN